MRSRSIVCAVLSLACLVAAMVYSVDRLLLLSRAGRTVGYVEFVSAQDVRCGRRQRVFRSCTEFTAAVAFTALNGFRYSVNVSAGTVQQTGKPTTYATLAPGQSVPVVYDLNNPTKAFRDSVADVWGVPILLSSFSLVYFLVSLFRSSEGRY